MEDPLSDMFKHFWSLLHPSDEKFKAFKFFERTKMVDNKLIMGHLSFIPMIAGMMIYHFGIKKTLCSFVGLMILGSLLTVPSSLAKDYSLYLCGETLMRGSTLVLWVTQIYMISKWFKGKKLSLAIGVLGVSKSIGHLIAVQLASYIGAIGLLRILSFGVILCVFFCCDFCD